MNLSRTLTITGLELRQRVRSVAWYVLLGVFASVLLAITVLSSMAWAGGPTSERGTIIYSTIVFFTLLLVALVSPAVSGNAINGDRENATLAGVQVTLATTADIVIGKWLAAWATGLTFLVVAVPFLIFSGFSGDVPASVVLSSLAVLIAETAVFAAFGVGLSGVIARGLFSVVATYLVVALFSIGTLIAFGLGGMAMQTPQTSSSRWIDENGTCSAWDTYESTVPRFDRVWGVLALNPFIVLADATPSTFTADGYPADLFTTLTYSIRSAQIAPEAQVFWDSCTDTFQDDPKPEEIIGKTVPSWYVGLGAHVLIGAGFLAWAIARTHTPARRLPPGTRIA